MKINPNANQENRSYSSTQTHTHAHTHKRIEKNVKQSLALNAIGDSSCDEKSFPIKKVQSPSNSSLSVCVCDGNIVA